MIGRLLLILAAVTLLAPDMVAQSRAEMLRLYPWIDTTGESGVYPIGDAVDVYKAALDLLYIDGKERPSVIVLHDTAEVGGDRPCPVSPCNKTWPHKSRIDTSTILGFARMSPKRPRILDFGYSIPIVLVSYRDQERMRADGTEYMAEHKLVNDMPGEAERYGLAMKFPGAWGRAELTKIGFNTAHTEALVQVRHWCGETCGSTETLFLKRIAGRWTVIERIPHYTEAQARGNMRYRGPAASTATESEIVVDENGNRPTRSESRDAAAVYRAVLDSLYNFYGQSPARIIVTDRFMTNYGDTAKPKTSIDAGLLQKYRFLSAVRSLPARTFTYRLPVKFVPEDAYPAFEKIGAPIAQKTGMMTPFWFGLIDEYPGVWGMVGLSKVAFNLKHTQAMVFSHHQCGDGCGNGETWVLKRSGETWRVVERLPRYTDNHWDPLWYPLRYIGLDADPSSYHHRRVVLSFVNAVTNQPLSFLRMAAFRNGKEHYVVSADSRGRIDLGTIPFAGIVGMTVGCPDPAERDSIYALEYVFSPGKDTTVTSRVDFRTCLRANTPHTLTGAEAFISATEARFAFPIPSGSEGWNLPLKNAAPGNTDYLWEVDWQSPRTTGDEPIMLWLRVELKPKQSAPRSLQELIHRHHPDVMILCQTCSESVMFADPETDTAKVLAKVEGNRVVFLVRGGETISKVFPRIPSVVTFRTMVRHVPTGKREGMERSASQAVVVNCHPSDSTGASRRRCNAPTNARLAAGGIDSTAPRRIRVVAINYDGSVLLRNRDVRITSEDRQAPSVTKSTGTSGFFSILHPSRDSVSVEALCPTKPASAGKVSGKLALYLGPGRDTTLQVIVDERRCNR